jgi:hypothetical protein
VPDGDFFRQPRREQINLKHPLVRMAESVAALNCVDIPDRIEGEVSRFV